MFDTDFRPSLSHSGAQGDLCILLEHLQTDLTLSPQRKALQEGCRQKEMLRLLVRRKEALMGEEAVNRRPGGLLCANQCYALRHVLTHVLMHVPKHTLIYALSCTPAHTKSCTKPPLNPLPSPSLCAQLFLGTCSAEMQKPKHGKGRACRGRGEAFFSMLRVSVCLILKQVFLFTSHTFPQRKETPPDRRPAPDKQV